jgi:hypothetical protein
VSGGREGVVKHIPQVYGDKKWKRIRQMRFHQEALFMHRMNGTPGILPVWDVDDAHGDKPRWYAMPRARLLAETIDDMSTVLDVVTRIATLSQTLASLAGQGTYHRDIKPDNLFWYDDAPVLADFGIAAFAHAPAGLTRHGEELGPDNFIAPEMRYSTTNGGGERADVYSLAKTLFVLAHLHRGPYPPVGTHRVDAEEFSLWALGSGSDIQALGHVLEAATQFRERDRLTMADFHAELRAWLGRCSNDPSRFPVLGKRAFGKGWGDAALFDRHRRDTATTRLMMLPCIRDIAEALTGDSGAWSEGIDYDNGDASLGKYGWIPNSDDGFEPDGGFLWLATHLHDGLRIVIEAVFDHDVCFIAEAHRGGPPWALEQQWGHTPWHRPRMPRTHDQLQELTDNVVEWLSTRTPRSDEHHGQSRRS